MSRISRSLAPACCFVSAGVSADQVPAMGKLLVATNAVGGPYVAKTVRALLRTDTPLEDAVELLKKKTDKALC